VRAVCFAYHNVGLVGLEALVRNGFCVEAVFTHEDDPNERCWFGSVAAWAGERGIPCYAPPSVNEDPWVETIEKARPEVLFSFYYRNLISRRILDLVRGEAFNLHGSLLPAYRGRVPVNWVLVNGETKTGVTLHYMIERADAGDIVAQREVEIAFTDTALTLYGKICAAAAVLLDEALPLIREGRTPRTPQDETRATTYGRRRPEDGRIDWRWPALRIYNLIRAVTEPYPGAFTHFVPPGGGAKKKVTIWWALPEGAAVGAAPGEIRLVGDGVFVQAGEGSLRLLDCSWGDLRLRDRQLIEFIKEYEGARLR